MIDSFTLLEQNSMFEHYCCTGQRGGPMLLEVENSLQNGMFISQMITRYERKVFHVWTVVLEMIIDSILKRTKY